jgi:hypothetical protein
VFCGLQKKAPDLELGACRSQVALITRTEEDRFLVTIFPVSVGVPLMVVAVPPSMVRVPAAFPLGVQIAPPLVRLVAALAVLANRLIQFGFRLLDLALALRVIVRVRLGHGNERRRTQSHCHNRRYRNSLKAL